MNPGDPVKFGINDFHMTIVSIEGDYAVCEWEQEVITSGKVEIDFAYREWKNDDGLCRFFKRYSRKFPLHTLTPVEDFYRR